VSSVRRFASLLAAFAILATLSPRPASAGLLVTANDDAYTAVHDRLLSIAAPGLLTNDSGVAPAAAKLTNPAHGTVTVNANGSFRYQPNAGYVGTDSFTYEARVLNLGILLKDPATVTLAVTNAAPVARDDSYVATTGVTLSVAAPGVLGNDSDADSDGLTALLNSSGGNGSLKLNPNGSFTYTSGGSFVGTFSFTYRVSDGIASSGLATVSITVHAPSPTPTPRPTPRPTPTPTPVPTPTATPSFVPSIVPSIVPSLVPSIVPSILPSPVPSAIASILPSTIPSILPGSSPSPAPPSPSSGSSAPPSSSLPIPSADATPTPLPTPTPSAGATGTLAPGAAGGGTTPGATPGSGGPGGPGGGDRPLTVPRLDSTAPVSVGGLSLAVGAFQWLVPAFVLTVPGLLLIVIVLAQLIGGGLFLPVARRALRGVGSGRASRRQLPA
jgi:hypothetical protein